METFRKCKTCAKDFSACSACERKGVFYWKAICCSIECFQAYAQKVLDIREKG